MSDTPCTIRYGDPRKTLASVEAVLEASFDRRDFYPALTFGRLSESLRWRPLKLGEPRYTIRLRPTPEDHLQVRVAVKGLWAVVYAVRVGGCSVLIRDVIYLPSEQ
jgi:hypothetical protein